MIGPNILRWLILMSALGQLCDPTDPTVSLYDLGIGPYKSFEGGLYSGGSNVRPPAHESAGIAIAQLIKPLSTTGVEDPNGRIGLISIGFSNMTQEWRTGAVGDPASVPLTFTSKATVLQVSGVVNDRVLIIDGAQGNQDTFDWSHEPPDIDLPPWSIVLARLSGPVYNSSVEQVQIACVKVATRGPSQCIASDGSFTGDAGANAANFAKLARNLKFVFPNIKLAYFVSRSYAGYALTNGNPEPFAYEQGFSIKWMIDVQTQGSSTYGDLSYQGSGATVPWMSWGAYLWANGLTPNGLGISWDINDFRPDDRTHPAIGGVDKAATAMLNFFLTDTTTRPWFGWQCLHGDVDGNGRIDGGDIGPLIDVWLNPPAAPVAVQCRADTNNDGVVDPSDISKFAELAVVAP